MCLTMKKSNLCQLADLTKVVLEYDQTSHTKSNPNQITDILFY
jgi:hypothetical protein